jgi:hypothetical protein
VRFIQVHSIINEEIKDTVWVNPNCISVMGTIKQEIEEDDKKIPIVSLSLVIDKEKFVFHYTNETDLINTIDNLNRFTGKLLKSNRLFSMP